ncbi:pentatricopeptide repeat-containing protein At1g50270 [Magnolia sinica]|uniref:pentatricopeptide repeat-containing protein At1g50270 n=1 Tax=Magnolia sinica TaxID=86752 RepID=UPI002659B6CF|nr:pentatricopeptide repeat-containing protein At1g50270 [Magnolia sinica]
MLAASPNQYLSLLQKCKTMAHLKQIHCLFIITGLSQDTFFMTKILHFCMFVRPRYLDYASLIFDRIDAPDTFIWNTMIRGFSISPQPEKSIVYFARMRRNGVIPDSHSYPFLLKALYKTKEENLNQIHGQIVKSGLDFNTFVRNSLVSAYANGGDLVSAWQVFGGIGERDTVAWTAMIDGCVRNNRAEEGLNLFMEMRMLGVEIDEVTIVSVLCGVGMVGDVWLGRWIHGFYVLCGRVIWDVFVGGALVDMYAKCGYCDDARKVFDEMPLKNAISWSVLIAGYVQSSRFKDALVVFQDMLLEEVVPNQPTFTSVLTACAQLGAIDQGRWVHMYMDKNKLEMNLMLGTALIDMYSKCGCIDEAFMVFQSLHRKDVYPWTAMINGLAMHGHALRSLDLFSRMLRDGVHPNAVTFIGVLSACSHGGLVDHGRMHFDYMSQVYGIKPSVEHYGCMVDLLGRAGHLEEAWDLIENMPMEPSAGVWGALFGACMIHKDFKLGDRVGKHLIKLQPHHSGRYALLANMYSISQKWEEAAHIRKLMKGKGVEKTPGCSWIEIDGAIHEFIALDKSHSKSNDIYLMLDGITIQLKAAGYAPDAAPLLFDMDSG